MLRHLELITKTFRLDGYNIIVYSWHLFRGTKYALEEYVTAEDIHRLVALFEIYLCRCAEDLRTSGEIDERIFETMSNILRVFE